MAAQGRQHITGGPGGSDALSVAVGIADGLAEGAAVEAVGLGTGVGSDAVGLGEAEGTGDAVTVALALPAAFAGEGVGDAVAMELPFAIQVEAVEAVGLATGDAARLPVATAGQDGEAARVTCRAVDGAVDGRCRTAPP